MALINFTGNIGDSGENPKESENNQKINEKTSEIISEKTNEEMKKEALENEKKQAYEEEVKLKKINRYIRDRKEELRNLEEYISEEKRILKRLKREISDTKEELEEIKESKHSNRYLEPVEKWKNRNLEEIYTVIFPEVNNFEFKSNGDTVSKSIYSVIGIDIKGRRDILGIWVYDKESSKKWFNIFNELKIRGIEDILIIAAASTRGFQKEVLKIFPESQFEKAIRDDMRVCNKYIYYKDLKPFNKDLMKIYLASTEEIALCEFEELKRKWGEKYPISIKSWNMKLSDLYPIFRFPEEIRKILYTTNILDRFDSKVKKISKDNVEIFNDEVLLEKIYLGTIELTYKWKKPIKGWVKVLSKLSIFFKDRVDEQLL